MNRDHMFHPTSPHRKRVRSDVNYRESAPNGAAVVEQNTSYARNYSAEKPNVDEDERFLQLAREALVATATANQQSSGLNPLVVDPTISDLLDRLQYALSPHGNPIKRGHNIQANENGQLMIQNFYRQFPNMSNDIFVDFNNHHPANTRSEGWNFLVGEPLELRAPAPKEEEEEELPAEQPESDDQDRKFFCHKCSMAFRRSSDLKRHEKQHFKVLPYICLDCGKSFARKDALKRHIGTLTCKRNTDKRLYVDNLNYLDKKNEK